MGATSQEVARHFGDNMRRLRKLAGISQEALGERASLHRTEIGLIERGARCPRIDTLVKLAAGLGVRIDCALFEGISWSSGETTTTAGEFTFTTRQERHAEAMRLAAEAREGQEETDVVQLLHEVREERAQQIDRTLRGEPVPDEGEGD